MASGTAARMASIASRAHGVRSVTSRTTSPPAASARASGTACSSFATVSTGGTKTQAGGFTKKSSLGYFERLSAHFLSRYPARNLWNCG
jgi:hypothetical protein